jgi:hypothetical protein
VHGIRKRKNAPTIEWKQMKEDENKMNKLIQYLDSLVTTINLGLDIPVPERHLCQKKSNELNDDQQDYINLINKLNDISDIVLRTVFVSTEKENRFASLDILKKLLKEHSCEMITIDNQSL